LILRVLMSVSITLRDFQPVGNGWKKDTSGETYACLCESRHLLIVNSTPGQKYFYRTDSEDGVEKIYQCIEHSLSSGPANECLLPEKWIVDSTGRKYFNEPKNTVRLKCLSLIFGTPFVHPIAAVVNALYRLFLLVTFVHFWKPLKGERASLKNRASEAGKDILRLFATPLLAALPLAALYGVFCPYDGRKLYATIERAVYGGAILAPCFQPDARSHLLGGDSSVQNVW